MHTWLSQGHEIRDVLHEDATFELEFRLSSLVGELFVRELVFGLAEVDVLATEEDSLEQVHMILQLKRSRQLVSLARP